MITRRFLARPSLTLGSLIVLAFILVAIASPLLAPPQGSDPYQLPRDGYSLVPQAPSPAHPLGTMEGQGDVFYGLIWGTRGALRLGLVVPLGRAIIGILVGLLAGYHGGLVDAVLMRITDAFLSFPIVAAVMVMAAIYAGFTVASAADSSLFGRTNQETAIVWALMLFGWMSYARLVRGNVLLEREKEYIQAARSAGVGSWRIILRHLLPNATRGLAVLLASDVGAVVVLVAAFNFIWLLPRDPSIMVADWGQMLTFARNWIIGTPADAFAYWYTYLPVSGAIVLFSFGWSLIGDGLRDALDPHVR
jgi:peptide/nickel transport system permease protein